MAKYRVLWHLNRNGKIYEPGQVINLSEEEGAGLHCLAPLGDSKDEAPKGEPSRQAGGPKEELKEKKSKEKE